MATEQQQQQAAEAARRYVSTFEHDVNVSGVEKQKALKTVQTILRNLSDPEKSRDEKYRQLRCSNPKIRALLQNASIAALLRSAVGFRQTDGGGAGEEEEAVLKVPHVPDRAAMETVLAVVSGALQRVSSSVLASTSSSLSAVSSSSSICSETATTTTTTMSEKQKARMLREKQLEKEREQAKESRKRTAAQIKADKHVRENDPDWKPSVSSAAGKSGSAISTFRDKYGE